MAKIGFSYCFYEEGEVIHGAEHIVFESARWQNYRSVLVSVIEMITASNIVGIVIASRENWPSEANYVGRILKLKKRYLEAAEHVGALA